MLSFKKVFCFILLPYIVCGNLIRNQQPNSNVHDNTTTKPQILPASTPADVKQCAPNKSLHSKNDIKVMIDHIYNETSLDKIIKQNYQTKAKAIRDKHFKNLNYFTGWLENQPVHLSHILKNLQRLRKVQLEPAVKVVAGILNEHTKLEMLYNKKLNKTNELAHKLERCKMIYKLNGEDPQIKEHNIVRRNIQDDLYCSSLEDLYNIITQNLDNFGKKLNNVSNNELSSHDKKYKEKIEEIKSKLKNKALKEFGRTMYDILSLEDEYFHFMNEITSTNLDSSVYTIKTLELHVDALLLQLEQAIDTKYGQDCNSRSAKTLIRNVRQADVKSEGNPKTESPNVIIDLIEMKFKEIVNDIEIDFKNIFNDLDVLIEKVEVEEVSFEKLKPLQNEINAMINTEKEALDKLKNLIPSPIIQKILALIKKLQELLEFIVAILNNL